MKEKYIKFFKKEIVFLLILLVVVSFSFGLTYSNFIYSSDSYRAVEMFTSKLDYELSEKEFTLKPGNNLIKINVKSLNNIESYYKVIYDNKNVNVRYYNNDKNAIGSNQNVDIYMIAFNKSNKEEKINFEIVGGFITNSYDDVVISNGYNEVKDNIEIGDKVTLNGDIYRLLSIYNDGSYELISDVSQDNLVVEGSNGYNQYISIINDNLDNIVGSVSIKALSIDDIEKYTSYKIVEYKNPLSYNNAYYPLLWSIEEGAVINNNNQETYYGRSEGVSNGNYEFAESIIVENINTSLPIFINEKYEDIFLNSKYLLATRYQATNEETASFGVLSIDNRSVKLNILFESNKKEYKVSGNNRIIVVMSNKNDLFSKSL